MERKTNKNKRRQKRNIDDFQIEQDENFSFIAGYTSGGYPYGNPWEETDDEQNEVVFKNAIYYAILQKWEMLLWLYHINDYGNYQQIKK